MSKRNDCRLSTIAVAALIAATGANSQTVKAVTGKTDVGTQPSGMKSLWSDWYADKTQSPNFWVNGAFSSVPNWTTVNLIPTLGSAVYTGNVVGREQSRSKDFGVTGNVNLNADFSRRILSGSFSDLKRSDGKGLNGRQETSVSFGGGWTGTSNPIATRPNTQGPDRAWAQMSMGNGTLTGEIQARFFNGTQGVGGAWYLSGMSSGVTGEKTLVSGAFAANVLPVVAAPAAAPAPVPAPAPKPAESPKAASPAPAPAPAPAAPVVAAPPAPVLAAAPLTGAFNSWAGTPKPGVVVAARELRPEGYSPTDGKQALYAGKSDAVVINLRDKGSASNVQGDVRLAVNISARTVKGEIGNFVGSNGLGSATGPIDASNFLNAGVIKVSAQVDSRTMGFQGGATWVPSGSKLTPASGSFTGLFDKETFFPVGGSPVTLPGKTGSGSVTLGNADFQLNGSWRATFVPPGR